MKRVLFSVVITWLCWLVTSVQAESPLRVPDFSGWELSFGSGSGSGNFGLGYTGFGITATDRSVVAISGDVSTVSLRYRWSLPHTPFYLGAGSTMYSGSLGGVRQWSIAGATATFAYASDTLYTFGVQAGYNPPTVPQLYLYGGAGVAVGNLTVRGSVHYEQDSVVSQVTGLAIGPTLSGGIEYAFFKHGRLGLDVTNISFAGDLPCYYGQCGQLRATVDQTIVTLQVGWNWKF